MAPRTPHVLLLLPLLLAALLPPCVASSGDLKAAALSIAPWLVEVRREQRTARTLFTAGQAPSGAWVVEDLQVAPLQDFCR